MKKNDLVLTRILSAPRHQVFAAWTDVGQLAAWWGPAGFTNRLVDVQPRPGGPFRLDMIGPDGTVYGMFGTFREVVPNERIVFASGALDDAGRELFEVLHVVTFADAPDGAGTRLTLEANVLRAGPGAEAALAGMTVGWSQSLDRLSDLAAQDRVIAAVRFVSAPRERVFAAFTDPAQLAQWWGPEGFRLTTHRADFRAGGEWRFTMHGPDGTDYPNLNRIVDFTPLDGLVFDHAEPPFRATIRLYAVAPDLTALHFQMVFPTAELRRHLAEKYGAVEGQQQTLNRLERLVGAGVEHAGGPV